MSLPHSSSAIRHSKNVDSEPTKQSLDMLDRFESLPSQTPPDSDHEQSTSSGNGEEGSALQFDEVSDILPEPKSLSERWHVRNVKTSKPTALKYLVALKERTRYSSLPQRTMLRIAARRRPGLRYTYGMVVFSSGYQKCAHLSGINLVCFCRQKRNGINGSNLSSSRTAFCGIRKLLSVNTNKPRKVIGSA
ncbi:hypothetical protein EJ08DRAFT_341421 [Tothia fuscella]|uniref:Uncharacterized protein n=1 Tax=Tothia fuscella TaxID=1048955 RepID=A0A9P4U3D4_9PEZI|nr:hypothetical protein EJ08DRAFT_341421 [Tothia fuscella]